MSSINNNYTVGTGLDVATFVRQYYVDGAGVPTPGLAVTYSLRDVSGTVLATGLLADLNVIAPGWYQLSTFVLANPGIYTVEYAPPAGFAVNADTIFVAEGIGTATTRFVKGG